MTELPKALVPKLVPNDFGEVFVPKAFGEVTRGTGKQVVAVSEPVIWAAGPTVEVFDIKVSNLANQIRKRIRPRPRMAHRVVAG